MVRSEYCKFALPLIALVAMTFSAQGQPREYEYTPSAYVFYCDKATPIDLYKAANLIISPEKGYWGDVTGMPYDGTRNTAVDSVAVRERPFTRGNIFDATQVHDTAAYRFYFYFTAANGYCDIEKGSRLVLNLQVLSQSCMDFTDNGFPDNHLITFCYGSNVDIFGNEYRSMTLEELLFTSLPDSISMRWRKDTLSRDSDWDDFWVFPDSASAANASEGQLNIRGANYGNTMHVNTSPDTLGILDLTYHVVIRREQTGDIVYHEFTVRILNKPVLEMWANPSGIVDERPYRSIEEFNLDDDITLGVLNEEMFNFYKYYINRKDLNKYYLQDDSTRSEITLSVLAFSGAEDILEVVAIDTSGCVATWSNDVIINVPFPSIFTPDGDGINDVFFGGEQFRNREFTLEIFNRWGSMLYRGSSGWDGTYRGRPAPPATYMYALHLKKPDGSTRLVKGTVTLVRQHQ